MYLIFHTNIIPITLDAHVIIDENMHTIWFEYLALSVYLLSPSVLKETTRNSKCKVHAPNQFLYPLILSLHQLHVGNSKRRFYTGIMIESIKMKFMFLENLIDFINCTHKIVFYHDVSCLNTKSPFDVILNTVLVQLCGINS